MSRFSPRVVSIAVFVVALVVFLGSTLYRISHRPIPAASRRVASVTKAPSGPYQGRDKIQVEIDAFRYQVRGYYNNRNFASLEKTMEELRATPSVFGNGSNKIYQYYDALECSEDEPETMWKLHDSIHQAWEKAYPQSVTSYIAHADFFTSYAWHARTSEYADKVTEEGWRLFGERLQAAQQLLEKAQPMTPACPKWWSVEMTVALGQGWDRTAMTKLYNDAKTHYPTYFNYDVSLAHYLLPRWFGKPGDWENTAAAEIQRPDGLHEEGYARVVGNMSGYYDNVFQETKASWPDTKTGLDQMRQKYPDSLGILSLYAKMAYLAKDRSAARPVFQALDGYVARGTWRDAETFNAARKWAMAD